MTDNIFEIETTAPGPCGVRPPRVWHSCDGLRRCINTVVSTILGSSLYFRAELPEFICRFCSLQESGTLLTDFAATYPSVNRSWIFFVLEKAELPEFICRLVRMMYCDSTTHVEFAGKNRGQLVMARGVRQGCSAIGSLFAMAFDPIFRWLQYAIIPKNPVGCFVLTTIDVLPSKWWT